MLKSAGDEDASRLQLGSEFQDAQCLFNTEVKLLLAQKRDERIGHYGNLPATQLLSPAFLNTLEYVSTFARFTDKNMAQYVRQSLGAYPLHDFELAQLANITPDSADEAKALIPSLAAKVTDDELQSICDLLSNARKLQS